MVKVHRPINWLYGVSLLIVSGAIAAWSIDYLIPKPLLIYEGVPSVGKRIDGVWLPMDTVEVGSVAAINYFSIKRGEGYENCEYQIVRNLYGQCGSAEIERLQAPKRKAGQEFSIDVVFQIPARFQAGACCYVSTVEVTCNPLHRLIRPLTQQGPTTCFETVVPEETVSEELEKAIDKVIDERVEKKVEDAVDAIDPNIED